MPEQNLPAAAVSRQPCADPPMPECERLLAVAPTSQAIGTFLDWLKDRGVHLAIEHTHCDECFGEDGMRTCGTSKGELVPHLRGTEQLLAEFFDIDLNKVGRERCALLDSIRAKSKEIANA